MRRDLQLRGRESPPLPPGADGRPGGGVAFVRGYVGAKISPTSGDVDIYRIDVPPMDARKAPALPMIQGFPVA